MLNILNKVNMELKEAILPSAEWVEDVALYALVYV